MGSFQPGRRLATRLDGKRFGQAQIGPGDGVADDGHDGAVEIGAALERGQVGKRAVEHPAPVEAGVLDDRHSRIRRQAGLDQPRGDVGKQARPGVSQAA